MIAMPFSQRFDESNRDRLRAANLRQELPGIFNWALEGARRLYAQDRFTDCAVCQACLGEHRLHSDPFRQFVEEELHLDPVGGIAKSEAYQCYRDYCVRNGHRPKNNSDFGKQMYGLGGVSEGRAGTGTRQRLYRGVRFARPQCRQQPAAPSPPATRAVPLRGAFRALRQPRPKFSPAEPVPALRKSGWFGAVGPVKSS